MSEPPAQGSFGPDRISAGIILVGLLLGVLYLLKILLTGGFVSFLFFAVPATFAAWLFMGHNVWWVLLPATLSFGGVFYFGVKIYAHELGLLMCILPLALSIALMKGASQHRPASPKSLYLLSLYVLAHMAASVFVSKSQGGDGIGSIGRVYAHALWPLIFLFAFQRHGSTKYLKHGLVAMYLAALFRALLGVWGYLSPSFRYVPGINFILPGGHTGGGDLRFSALTLLSLSLCFLAMSRPVAAKLFHGLMACLASGLIWFGGGRVSLAMSLVVLGFWCVVQKKYVLLLSVIAAIATMAGVLNATPSLAYSFPRNVRRTLSVLILKKAHSDVHRMVELSDDYHFGLGRAGFRRWTRSIGSALLGNRVHPYSQEFYAATANTDLRIEIASKMGTYESGLWTALAVLGAVGAVLYISLFRAYLSGIIAEVFAGRIHDYTSAFYFLAVSSALTWAAFCWISGHFPSRELMLCGIARIAYYDATGGGEVEQEID